MKRCPGLEWSRTGSVSARSPHPPCLALKAAGALWTSRNCTIHLPAMIANIRLANTLNPVPWTCREPSALKKLQVPLVRSAQNDRLSYSHD
jgi:hypothetical protein